MITRNNILTNQIDLTNIFIVGGVIDVYDSTLTNLYAINYLSNDYPINSIDFPNLTTITRNTTNQIDNDNLTNINLPNLNNCWGFSIDVNNCNINLQSLTFSNSLSFYTATASSINLDNLQEVNGLLLFDSPNDISLPSLIKVNNDLNVLCNEFTCDNLEYVSNGILLNIKNTINDLDLSQLSYVGVDVQISGNLTTDINLISLTNSNSIIISAPSSSNIFLDNFVETTNQFAITTNAISLTFSNLILTSQAFDINGCNTLQSLSVPNLNNSPISIQNNPNLTSIDISGLTTTNKIIINNNTSLETIDLSSLDNIKVNAEDTGNNLLYIDESNSNLKSIDLSGLITVNNNVISLVQTTGFPNLEEVILNNAVDATNIDIRFANLTQTSVDNILVALDTAGYSGGTVDLSGGTSAAPSVGTGQPAVTSLQGKGWTVTTN